MDFHVLSCNAILLDRLVDGSPVDFQVQLKVLNVIFKALNSMKQVTHGPPSVMFLLVSLDWAEWPM